MSRRKKSNKVKTTKSTTTATPQTKLEKQYFSMMNTLQDTVNSIKQQNKDYQMMQINLTNVLRMEWNSLSLILKDMLVPIRQKALEMAAEMATTSTSEFDEEQVQQLADKYVQYILGGKAIELAVPSGLAVEHHDGTITELKPVEDFIQSLQLKITPPKEGDTEAVVEVTKHPNDDMVGRDVNKELGKSE